MKLPPNSLASQLESVTQQALADFPEEVRRVFAEKTASLIESDLVSHARSIGDAVEDFSLPTTDGGSIALSRQLESGPLVLSFYRGTWCPYCSLEYEELRRWSEEALRYSASLLAVSPQQNGRFPPTGHAPNFHDAIDRGNVLARRFGLVYDLGSRMNEIYLGFGIDLAELNADQSRELPLPASYVLDQEGIIRYAFIEADSSKRAEPSDIVKAVQQLAA